MALNLKIHPSSLKSNDGVTKLEDLTKVYFEQGGMEVQYNIVDAATLRKAQANPKEYHNLVVRIRRLQRVFRRHDPGDAGRHHLPR
jgi:pyruvate-formate lyase